MIEAPQKSQNDSCSLGWMGSFYYWEARQQRGTKRTQFLFPIKKFRRGNKQILAFFQKYDINVIKHCNVKFLDKLWCLVALEKRGHTCHTPRTPPSVVLVEGSLNNAEVIQARQF